MATTQWRGASVGANDNSYGTIAWVNPTNITASDGSNAVATITAEAITNYLKATDFKFDHSDIPLGSVILGAEVRLTVSGGALNTISEDRIRWVRAGTIDSANIIFVPSSGGWAAAGEVKTFGSATELGAFTWTAAQVHDSGTGVVIAATEALGTTANVDYVEMRWHYNLASAPGGAGGLLLRDVGV